MPTHFPPLRIAPSRFLFAACAAALALLCAQSHAQTAPVRPGAWQVVSGAPGQPMVGYQVCLKNGADDLHLLLPRVVSGNPACGPASTRREGEDLVWELSCPSGATQASGRYKVQAESLSGEISITTGNPPQTRRENLRANYAGPCPQ